MPAGAEGKRAGDQDWLLIIRPIMETQLEVNRGLAEQMARTNIALWLLVAGIFVHRI